MHHNVADGTGIAEIIRLWAACTRGGGHPEKVVGGYSKAPPRADEPLHREAELRVVAAGPAAGSYAQLLGELPQLWDKDHPLIPAPAPALASPPIRGSTGIYAFSVRKLEAARTRARIMAATPAGMQLDPRSLSLNNILCAVMRACITHARAARCGDGSSPLCC